MKTGKVWFEEYKREAETPPTYYRASKQPWWRNDGTSRDHLMVGLYLKDGGCLLEFAIEQHHLNKPALRVCLYDDAVQALADPEIALALAALREANTLDEAEKRLQEHDIKERKS